MTTLSLTIPDITRVAAAITAGYGRPAPTPGTEAQAVADLLAEHVTTLVVQVEAAAQSTQATPADIIPPAVTAEALP